MSRSSKSGAGVPSSRATTRSGWTRLGAGVGVCGAVANEAKATLILAQVDAIIGRCVL
jgi:hypothetical protein